MQLQMIGFFNQDRQCLLCSTNRIFKYHSGQS